MENLEIAQVKKRDLIRTDKIFFEDMLEINARRMDKGKKKFSDRMILQLLRRHSFWQDIKEDIINYAGE